MRLGRWATGAWPWVILGVLALPVAIFFWRHSDPRGASTYFDFDAGYYAGSRAVLQMGASALKAHYDDMSFVNLPIVAWVLMPFGRLERGTAEVSFGILNLLCSAGALYWLARRERPGIAYALCLLFLFNGPLWNNLKLGNSSQIVLLCLVGAVMPWGRRHGYLLGLLIGAAAVVKPMLVLLGLYYVFKRRWPVVLGGATVILAAGLASVAVAGWGTTLYWYQHIVSDYAGKPMPAYNVQSIEAFILRLSVGTDTVMAWHPHPLPLWGRIARDVVFAVLLGLVAWALWPVRRAGAAGGEAAEGGMAENTARTRDDLEFCIVLTFCIMVSTVSWAHYYMLLLIPYALYLAGRLPLPQDGLTRGLVWASLLCCSLPVNRYAFPSETLQSLYYKSFASIWLFGGLLLMAALLRGACLQIPRRRSSAMVVKSAQAMAAK